VQQIHAYLILKVMHLAAQSRLRDPKLSRSPSEAQLPSDGDEVAQVPQFHG
jgi:hypothetical protein